MYNNISKQISIAQKETDKRGKTIDENGKNL